MTGAPRRQTALPCTAQNTSDPQRTAAQNDRGGSEFLRGHPERRPSRPRERPRAPGGPAPRPRDLAPAPPFTASPRCSGIRLALRAVRLHGDELAAGDCAVFPLRAPGRRRGGRGGAGPGRARAGPPGPPGPLGL